MIPELPRARKIGQWRLFHGAVARGHEDIFALFFEIVRGDHGGQLFAVLEFDEMRWRLPRVAAAASGIS